MEKKGEMFQIYVDPDNEKELFIRDWFIQVDGQRIGERERRMRMLHDINVEKKLELTRRQAELARSKALIGADTDDEEFGGPNNDNDMLKSVHRSVV